MAKQTHPHAAALDRIGRELVIQYFGITQSAYSNWKRIGVPPIYRKPIAVLAVINGISVPELGEGGI